MAATGHQTSSSPLPGSPANFFISAARKSSGKTTITLGLTRAFTKRGLNVQTFKKGPDYIDPLWHQQASGHSCFNLDFNTQSETEIINTFYQRSGKADLAIIEANKGLFDGLDVSGSDSNAQLAKILKSPIILVIDTLGMTRGIAPLLHGYSTFDPDISISGLILNNTGGSRHEEKLRNAVEYYSDIPVLGCVGRNDELAVRERHLGLTTPGEKSGAAPLIEQLAAAMENSVDLDKVLKIAASALGKSLAAPLVQPVYQPAQVQPDITIAIPRDEAFGFYYADDLDALRAAGAKLLFFSALTDSKMPDADGLFIGGGFPETHMAKLEANQSLRNQIKAAIDAGLPTYAECGGLMYLSRSIEWSGETSQMVGAIEGDCQMNKKPQGRGFAKLQQTALHPWTDEGEKEAEIPAHEFHYANIKNLPPDTRYAFNIKRGHGIDGEHDGIVINNMLASFCHLRHTNRTPWADKFVEFVRRCKNNAAA